MERKFIRSCLKAFIVISGLTLFSVKEVKANAYGWGNLGSGTNGTVYSMTYFNGRIIVGGSFTTAGGLSVNNIAQWSPTNGWQIFDANGFNGTVYTLVVFSGDLYAGGSFTQSGTTSLAHVARWGGSQWMPVGAGFNGDVTCLEAYNNGVSTNLYAGGLFTTSGGNPVNHIALWQPPNWNPAGSGTNSDVYALKGWNTVLYVGGSFTTAGGNSANFIASWNVSAWGTLGAGVNDTVQSLAIFGGQLIAGGNFTTAGGNAAPYIARWDGAIWSGISGGMSGPVFSLASYNSELIAGGVFKYSNNHYVDRIAKWNGNDWSRMITGTNNRVNTLLVHDTSLFAGGSFTTAGGKYISRIAEWSNQETVTISGVVRYADNNQLVPSGFVKAIRIDVNTREIIVTDTTIINNGNYLLDQVLKDSNTYILSFPPDEFLMRSQATFVPTYYPSSIDWQNATRIHPINPLTNINIGVVRIAPEPGNPMLADISGHVYLRFTPPMDLLDVGLPYKSGAIVYARQGSLYRNFGVSNTLEEYLIPQLAPGTYEFYVNRMGYTDASRTVVVGSVNVDTIDFYLDTAGLIGIHTISTEVPEGFALYQNFPNPFNPVTKIKFDVPSNVRRQTSNVEILVYDILGREIVTLVNEALQPGTYEVTWNALNVSSGIYVYRLEAGDAGQQYVESKKMVLIK